MILDDIIRFLMIIPPIVGIWRWRYMDTPIKIYFGLTCFSFLVSSASHVLGSLSINTYFLTYVNVLGSLCIFNVFFYSLIKNKLLKNIIPLLFLPLLFYIIYEIKTKNVLFSTGLFIYHDVIVVITTAFLLVQTFNENNTELRKQPHFWVYCSILFFYNFDLIFAFLVANLFTTLNTFFSILFFKIYPTFNLTFTLINTYIFYKTKHWQKPLKR